ncbi:MAG: hydantoinase B/oxoprolinase family protein [Rhodoplanes sp.]
MRTDPVQLEILMQQFRSITEEMAYALQRTGYTVFVNETADVGVSLVTPEGEIFGYPRSIGIATFGNLDFSDVIRAFPSYEEGDIVIFNDPYTSGGAASHLSDVNVIKPVFHDGRLVCFVFAYVHSTDMGGKVAGSLSPTSYEIFQEGVRIPPIKLFKAGEINQDVLDLILLNCRTPKDNWGDLRAMVTALKVGDERVRETIGRFGITTFIDAMYDAIAYSEQRARLLIERIPDGVYRFHDYLDDDVATNIPIRVAVAVTVEGSNLTVDFSGTDPQVRSAFNLFSTGKPHPWLIYKLMFMMLTLEPDIPMNAGMMRPVTVIAAEGSIVNCQFPAAVGLRTTLGVRVQDAICGALANALPELMPACGAGYMAPMVFAQPNLEEGGLKVIVLEPMTGGTGACSEADGFDARDVVDLANLRNNPLEIVESRASVLIRVYALATDSGGAGKFRGGCGCILELEVLVPDCVMIARGQERHRFRPWGLMGGNCGAKATAFMAAAGTTELKEIGKVDTLRLSAGDIVRIVTSGGGGYGDPFEREPQRVLNDVLDGLVSVAAAERDYGVIIRDGAIDLDATAARRAAGRAAKGEAVGLFTFGPERLAYEKVWTEELAGAFNALLFRLPIPMRGELRQKLWAAIEDNARQGLPTDVATLEEAWAALAPRFAGKASGPARALQSAA